MVENKDFKQTEIGLLPKDWDVIPITKATREVFLGLTSKVDYVDYGGVPLVRATDISGGNLSFSKAKTISIQQHKKLTKFRRAQKGDVLVSKSGSLGVCAIVDVDFEFSIYESIIVLKPNNLMSSDYLLWLMRDEKTQIRMIGEKVGSGVAHLNLEMFRKLQIPLPKVDEQIKISAMLNDINKTITKLESLIEKKEMIKQGVMQELLTGKRRLPGFGEKWEELKLRDIAKIIRGASPRPIENPVWFSEISNVGWVRISDVTKTNKYLKETTQRLSDLGIKHSRFVPNGNLIMSICATVGRPVLTKIDVCIHDGFVVFSEPCLDKEYLYYYLSSIEALWSKHGQTGSQMNLNTSLLNNTGITFPPNQTEQKAIASLLSDIDAEINTLSENLSKYKLIKQGMMQELLTGRRRLI